jgi:hypothetical protein
MDPTKRFKTTTEAKNAKRGAGSNLTHPCFSNILSTHLKRLAGAAEDIDDLPLDVASIAYVVLLVEREALLEDSSADSTEWFTEEALLEANDYVDSGAEGRLRPTEAASTMSRCLDRVFPTMPGMGWVAILAQPAESRDAVEPEHYPEKSSLEEVRVASSEPL